jgi:hypothetical protein
VRQLAHCIRQRTSLQVHKVHFGVHFIFEDLILKNVISWASMYEVGLTSLTLRASETKQEEGQRYVVI